MRLRVVTMALLLMSLLLSSNSWAGYFGAADMYEACRHRAQTDATYERNRNLCIGFLGGVADTLDQSYFCLPPRLALGDIQNAYLRYLTKNRQYLEYSAWSVARDAIHQEWPCPSQ